MTANFSTLDYVFVHLKERKFSFTVGFYRSEFQNLMKGFRILTVA